MERNTPSSGSMGDPDECRALNKLSAYVWSEEVFNSIHRAFESQSSNQEDGEDEVRQSGRDVNSLEKTTVGFSISEKLLVRKPCSGSHLNEWKFPTHASFMVWKIKHIHLPTDRKTNVDLEPRHTLFIAPDVLGVTVAADGTDLQSYRAYLWIKKAITFGSPCRWFRCLGCSRPREPSMLQSDTEPSTTATRPSPRCW